LLFVRAVTAAAKKRDEIAPLKEPQGPRLAQWLRLALFAQGGE